eukprot:TRINITY_DN51806_c0_g1_i1.p2 TRINITY_DN51806_c0_g1~~TRINITY_DN51806_c0_g1_i1.p2  ORF type:complete len:150 (-),score=20.30 TRINITY_DN51806_c0_g1_i1:66-515(-)
MGNCCCPPKKVAEEAPSPAPQPERPPDQLQIMSQRWDEEVEIRRSQRHSAAPPRVECGADGEAWAVLDVTAAMQGSQIRFHHSDHPTLDEDHVVQIPMDTLGPAVRVRATPVRLTPAASSACLLYTSDAADEEDSVDLGGRRIIKKKKV